MSLFHEQGQNSRIAGAQAGAQSAQRTAESVQSDLAGLENKIESLTLICRAMWSILEEKHNMSETELMTKVQEFAVRATPTVNCQNCHRVMNKKHTKCMYCGTVRTFESIFDTL